MRVLLGFMLLIGGMSIGITYLAIKDEIRMSKLADKCISELINKGVPRETIKTKRGKCYVIKLNQSF